MNEQAIRHALSLANTVYVSDATRIPPQTLQRIIDGAVPTPEQIDLIYGYFRGEFFLSGTSFQWERSTRKVDTLPLPLGAPFLPGPEYPPAFTPPPNLKPGLANAQKHPANSEAFTGSGKVIR